MSFLRMQESPSSATLGDSCMRRNDRNETFETASLIEIAPHRMEHPTKGLVLWLICTDLLDILSYF
ncbi:MAG: hypothetical protein NT007_17605 [Candidatus Kapabacteria bacterium]|nr:hypothetical protein [Candidatus Kapabacteria bacterium]